MNIKYMWLYLIIALIVMTAITWNDPNWQIEIPALYFFSVVLIFGFLDVGALEGYFRSKSPGYISNIDDEHSNTSVNHKDFIDYIDPLFANKSNPVARFTCTILGGLDYSIICTRGRGPIQIYPSSYLRKKNDGFVNDGEFEIWYYDELTPAMKDAIDKFSKIKGVAKNDKVPIWVSTVSNLDGSNVKSNIDHNEAVKQSQRERDAIEKDYNRVLEFLRGKRVLTRKGKKDKTTYDEPTE